MNGMKARFVASQDISAGDDVILDVDQITRDDEGIFFVACTHEPSRFVPPQLEGDRIFRFVAGEIDHKEFVEWREDIGVDPSISRSFHQLHVRRKHYCPDMNIAGELLFVMHREAMDPHCQIALLNGSNLRMSAGDTVRTFIRFFVDESSMDELNKTPMTIIWQGWQRDGWNPPVAFMIHKGQWAAQCYGHNGDIGGRNDWDIQRNLRKLGRVTPGYHTAMVTYKPSVTDGVFQVEIDGSLVVDEYGSNVIDIDEFPIQFVGTYMGQEDAGEGVLIGVNYLESTVVSDRPSDPEPDPEPDLDPDPDIVERGKIHQQIVPEPGERRVGITTSLTSSPSGHSHLLYVNYTTSGESNLMAREISRMSFGESTRVARDVHGCSLLCDDQGYFGWVAKKGDSGNLRYHWISGVSIFKMTVAPVGLDWVSGDVCAVIDRRRAIFKHHTHVGNSQLRTYKLYDKTLRLAADLKIPIRLNQSVYGICPFKVEGGWAAVISVFDIDRVTESGSQIGPITPFLYKSQDLVTWEKCSDEPFVPHGDGFDSGMIVMSTSSISLVKGYRDFVYGGSNYLHSMFWSEQPNSVTSIGRYRVADSYFAGLLT